MPIMRTYDDGTDANDADANDDADDADDADDTAADDDDVEEDLAPSKNGLRRI